MHCTVSGYCPWYFSYTINLFKFIYLHNSFSYTVTFFAKTCDSDLRVIIPWEFGIQVNKLSC